MSQRAVSDQDVVGLQVIVDITELMDLLENGDELYSNLDCSLICKFIVQLIMDLPE